MENYQVADADTPLPTLVGPNNFCVAIRNPAVAEAIADELNRLAAEVERLREEVAMYRSALANALEIALPMPQPPENG